MTLVRSASRRIALLLVGAAATLTVVLPASTAEATPPVDKYCETQQNAYDYWIWEATYTTSPSYWEYATDRAIRALVNLNRYCNF